MSDSNDKNKWIFVIDWHWNVLRTFFLILLFSLDAFTHHCRQSWLELILQKQYLVIGDAYPIFLNVIMYLFQYFPSTGKQRIHFDCVGVSDNCEEWGRNQWSDFVVLTTILGVLRSSQVIHKPRKIKCIFNFLQDDSYDWIKMPYLFRTGDVGSNPDSWLASIFPCISWRNLGVKIGMM